MAQHCAISQEMYCSNSRCSGLNIKESSNSDILQHFVSLFVSRFLKDTWIKVWAPLLSLNCPWWVLHTWADTHQTPADREHSRVHTHSDQAGIHISNLNLPSVSSRHDSLWPASKMTDPTPTPPSPTQWRNKTQCRLLVYRHETGLNVWIQLY